MPMGPPGLALWSENPDGYGRSQSPDWKASDWPVLSVRSGALGSQISYVDLGGNTDKTPCLFLHGIGNSWHFWLEVLGAIGQERRVIAIDLPGFGASGASRRSLSAAGAAAVVEEVCRQLGLGQVAVCGHSMGALVGFALAGSFPDRVERLLVVGGSLFSITDLYLHPVRTTLRSAGPMLTLAVGMVGASLPSPAFVRRAIANGSLLRVLFLHRFVRYPARLEPRLLAKALSGLGGLSAVKAVIAGVGFDFRKAVGAVACPVYVLNGVDDQQVPVRDVLEFMRVRPSAHIVLLADTGHWPMIERPRIFAQWVRGALAGFPTMTTSHPAASTF